MRNFKVFVVTLVVFLATVVGASTVGDLLNHGLDVTGNGLSVTGFVKASGNLWQNGSEITASATELNRANTAGKYLSLTASDNNSTTDNATSVTYQVVGGDGAALSNFYVTRVWVNNGSTLAVAATAPDGSGIADDGLAVSTGTEVREVTDEKELLVGTNSTGAFKITLNDDDTDNNYGLVVVFGNKVYMTDWSDQY